MTGKRDITLQSIIRSPMFLLGVLLLAPFVPSLLFPGGRIIGNPTCDNPSMFYYINDFAGRCWRQGFVPLWNPHIMLGLPFLGEGQAALFHPLSWLFMALPTGAALNWLIALCVLLSGLAFYGWLRALELGRAASFLGAVTWSFSTMVGGRFYAGHLTILLELVEIPLVLMFWERYRRQRQIKYLFGLAAAYGAMILAAYPQLLYTFSLFFMLYILIQSAPALLTREGAREEGRAILLLGVFVLLGVGIGAVQLLPAADFAAQSGRAAPSLEFCWTYALPPENLLSVVVPRFWGFTPESGPAAYWGRHNFWEACIYLGLLPLLLVPAGILATPPRRRWAMLVCSVLFTAVALGGYTPLFEWFYNYLPGFKYFRGPSKYVFPMALCLVTFSACGIESLLHPPEGRARRRQIWVTLIGAAVVLAVAVGLIGYRMMHFNQPEMNVQTEVARARWADRELLRACVFIALSLGVIVYAWRARPRQGVLAPLLLAVMLPDLLWVFLPLVTHYDEQIVRCEESFVSHVLRTPYPARVLAPTLFANMGMHHGYASASGYSGNTLGRFNTFINISTGQAPDTLQVINPIRGYAEPYRFLSFDFAMVTQRDLTRESEILAVKPPLHLVRFPQPFPRAFLAAAPVAAEKEAAALMYVRTPSSDVLGSPVIERADLGDVPAAPLRPGEGVRFVDFKPNRVELEAQAAQRRVLVLGEAYERNWTATINGQRVPVFPANYLFRGVVVPAGRSRVVFEYRPASFRYGRLITLLSLGIAIGGVAGAGRGRRKKAEAPLTEAVQKESAIGGGGRKNLSAKKSRRG